MDSDIIDEIVIIWPWGYWHWNSFCCQLSILGWEFYSWLPQFFFIWMFLEMLSNSLKFEMSWPTFSHTIWVMFRKHWFDKHSLPEDALHEQSHKVRRCRPIISHECAVNKRIAFLLRKVELLIIERIIVKAQQIEENSWQILTASWKLKTLERTLQVCKPVAVVRSAFLWINWHN